MINRMWKLLFVSCVLTSFFSVELLGVLEDHLKPAPSKGDGHQIRNIDFIYMINLDQRPEKFELACSYLHKYNIYPYRFSAVNGWELTHDQIADIGVKYRPGMTPLLGTTYPKEAIKLEKSHEYMDEYGKTYFVHCMSPGAMGCYLSHLSVLKDAIEAGYETIWVMEDDVATKCDPNILSDIIDELDALKGRDNWDVLFTDFDYRIGEGEYLPAYGAPKRPDMDCSAAERTSDKYMKSYVVSPRLRKIAARFGTASMIIRRSGMIKLYEFARTRGIYLPIDLENHLPPGIQRYGLTFDVVTNMLNSLSDIGNPDYLNKPK